MDIYKKDYKSTKEEAMLGLTGFVIVGGGVAMKHLKHGGMCQKKNLDYSKAL